MDAGELLANARAAQTRGEIGEAKEWYRRLMHGYPRSDEARIGKTEHDALVAADPFARTLADEPGPQRVVVVDLDVKFATMVWLMIKLAIAAIPAAIILYAIGVAVLALLAGIGGSL